MLLNDNSFPNGKSSDNGYEYINASPVRGLKNDCEFIITQFPFLKNSNELRSTVADFWRMVFKYRLGLVVVFASELAPEGDQTQPSKSPVDEWLSESLNGEKWEEFKLYNLGTDVDKSKILDEQIGINIGDPSSNSANAHFRLFLLELQGTKENRLMQTFVLVVNEQWPEVHRESKASNSLFASFSDTVFDVFFLTRCDHLCCSKLPIRVFAPLIESRICLV